MEILIEKLSQEEILKRGIKSWPIWTKEISIFDWTYDSREQCLFLEGEVTVKYPGGATDIKKGDFVTFPKGLSCTWNVKKPVKKHYQFD